MEGPVRKVECFLDRENSLTVLRSMSMVLIEVSRVKKKLKKKNLGWLGTYILILNR